MPAVNGSTTAITNLDTVPRVMPAVEDKAGRMKIMPFTYETPALNSAGAIIRIARVHSLNRVVSILLFRDALTAGAVDVGLYDIGGGAVVDADAYGSAVAISAADKLGLEVAFEARGIEKMMNYVWQDAGVAAANNKDYDIALTVTTEITDAGTISGYVIFEDRT